MYKNNKHFTFKIQNYTVKFYFCIICQQNPPSLRELSKEYIDEITGKFLIFV